MPFHRRKSIEVGKPPSAREQKGSMGIERGVDKGRGENVIKEEHAHPRAEEGAKEPNA